MNKRELTVDEAKRYVDNYHVIYFQPISDKTNKTDKHIVIKNDNSYHIYDLSTNEIIGEVGNVTGRYFQPKHHIELCFYKDENSDIWRGKVKRKYKHIEEKKKNNKIIRKVKIRKEIISLGIPCDKSTNNIFFYMASYVLSCGAMNIYKTIKRDLDKWNCKTDKQSIDFKYNFFYD